MQLFYLLQNTLKLVRNSKYTRHNIKRTIKHKFKQPSTSFKHKIHTNNQIRAISACSGIINVNKHKRYTMDTHWLKILIEYPKVISNHFKQICQWYSSSWLTLQIWDSWRTLTNSYVESTSKTNLFIVNKKKMIENINEWIKPSS